MSKDNWPKVETKTYVILDAVDRLSKGTTKGRTPVAEIYQEIGGSKEVIRTLLNILKKRGLVETPLRAMYKITDKGQKILDDR